MEIGADAQFRPPLVTEITQQPNPYFGSADDERILGRTTNSRSTRPGCDCRMIHAQIQQIANESDLEPVAHAVTEENAMTNQANSFRQRGNKNAVVQNECAFV